MKEEFVNALMEKYSFFYRDPEKKVYKNRIRVVLAEKMITNTYLAEQLGVSKMTISRWCTNTTQPSAPQLIEISQVLQCDLKDLYETEK